MRPLNLNRSLRAFLDLAFLVICLCVLLPSTFAAYAEDNVFVNRQIFIVTEAAQKAATWAGSGSRFNQINEPHGDVASSAMLKANSKQARLWPRLVPN
jgi:hypothetical protein